MMAKIHASKAPVGIITWHPDRLARNSVDGGQIIYSIDTGKVVALCFPTFWFEPTPQGLFMLQVAFGQSKYYSDNLSENVKRGIRQKLRRGEWPGKAPLGYINNLKSHDIEPDPIKSKIIAKAFAEYATGKHSLESLCQRLNFWGVVNRYGKPLSISTVQRMLTCKAYIGVIERTGESYAGGFPPIVSVATFEKVQQVLKDKSKPRYRRQKHNFPFIGLFRCGECGSAITAQYAKGNGGRYVYYRCTKKRGVCSQSYLREDLLLAQLRQLVSKVAIYEDWQIKMLAQIEKWQKETNHSSQTFAQNISGELRQIEKKLDVLVDSLLDGVIEKSACLTKKDELIRRKVELEQKKADFGQKGNNWIEPLKQLVREAHNAEKIGCFKRF